MKETLLYIISAVVSHPEDVEITESGTPDRVTLTLKVHEEDMGKVIGKSGRIIRAIRDLIKLIAAKKNIYADVVLVETGQPPAESQ